MSRVHKSKIILYPICWQHCLENENSFYTFLRKSKNQQPQLNVHTELETHFENIEFNAMIVIVKTNLLFDTKKCLSGNCRQEEVTFTFLTLNLRKSSFVIETYEAQIRGTGLQNIQYLCLSIRNRKGNFEKLINFTQVGFIYSDLYMSAKFGDIMKSVPFLKKEDG